MRVSPWASRPNTDASTTSSEASAATSASSQRDSPAGRTAASWAPDERRARLDHEAHRDFRARAFGAIDFLRRLRRPDDPGAGREREVDPRAVAARHAAAGIDDNRLALGAGAGKAQPEAAGLEQAGGLGAGAGKREAARISPRARCRSPAAARSSSKRSILKTMGGIRQRGRLVERGGGSSQSG